MWVLDRTMNAKLRHVAAALAVLAALAACAAPPAPAPAEPVGAPAASLDTPFTLAIGDSATLSDAPVTISFDAVSEDSRCPTKVTCVWIGRAVLAITAIVDGRPAHVTLATVHSPERTDRATLGRYEIVLDAVQPYPDTPDEPIRREEYRAEFTVRAHAAPS
jgi:hypothetical protein